MAATPTNDKHTPFAFLSSYRAAAAEREARGVPPLPLDAPQTEALTRLLQQPPAGEEAFLLDMLSNRIPPGVDEAAYVKATWLSAVARGITHRPLVSAIAATKGLANGPGRIQGRARPTRPEV